MCKAVNVKHLGKKIIGVYTMYYNWSALKMWFQMTHYFQYWMIMSWQDLKKNIFLVEVDKSSLGKDEHCCKIYFWYMRWYCTKINKKNILKRENLIVLCLVFVFDLFVFGWSGSSIGDQTFNWYEQLNSWLIFNWSEELNSWPSFDWSEKPYSWPNFENKEWLLRQKCQNLCKPKNF